MKTTGIITCLFFSMVFFSGCNRHAFFYYPNNNLYNDPEKLGLSYEFIRYPSANGKNLYAILFHTADKPKGIVVHFHGNYGNVSNHFLESQFLTKYGYDVLIFDYQGYGGSEGKPAPKKTVDDGRVTIRLAAARNRNPNGGVVVLGQSLGAAVATVVTAKEPLVKAIVLEAGFTSYRSMARDVIKRSILLWPLYPFYPFILSDRYDPIDYIEKISPRPVLIVHGISDEIVPVSMSRKLYAKAVEPKTLWLIEGARHLGCRAKEGIRYEENLASFFDEALLVKKID